MRVRLIQPPSRAEQTIEIGRDQLFRVDMKKAIMIAIAMLDSGTVGISADNLWQLTVRHIASRHSPTGTNAGWVARQVFNEIITSQPFCKIIL